MRFPKLTTTFLYLALIFSIWNSYLIYGTDANVTTPATSLVDFDFDTSHPNFTSLTNFTAPADPCSGLQSSNNTGGWGISPGFPANYPNNLQPCTYGIEVDSIYQSIEITFHDFITEPCCEGLLILSPLTYSFITLRGNLTSTLPLIHRIPGHAATLFFGTDESITFSGFRFSWKGSNETASTDAEETPTDSVVVAPGDTLTIAGSGFSTDVAHNLVRFSNTALLGVVTSANATGITFIVPDLPVGEYTLQVYVLSVGNAALNISTVIVHDVSSPTAGSNGAIPVCDEWSMNSGENSSSPGFPGSYSNNYECVFEINTTSPNEFQSIEITFHQFRTQEFFDTVRISDRNSLVAKVHGDLTNSLPIIHTVRGNYARIHFYTDESVTDTGFMFTWKASSIPFSTASSPGMCGSQWTYESEGWATSPGFPDHYPDNLKFCSYTILTQQQYQSIEITFHDFITEPCCEGIIITNPLTYSVVTLRGDLNSSLPLTYRILGNSATILFQSDESVSFSGFRFSWRGSYETALLGTEDTAESLSNITCPQTAGLIQGSATSPSFPADYPNNIECSYTITVPEEYGSIVFTFHAFNTERYFDSLKISSGSSVIKLHGELDWIGPIPGSPPLNYTVYGNKAQVQFYTNGNTTEQGFAFEWFASYDDVPTTAPPLECPGGSYLVNGATLTFNSSSGMTYSHEVCPDSFSTVQGGVDSDTEAGGIGQYGNFTQEDICRVQTEGSPGIHLAYGICTDGEWLFRRADTCLGQLIYFCGADPFSQPETLTSEAPVIICSSSSGTNNNTGCTEDGGDVEQYFMLIGCVLSIIGFFLTIVSITISGDLMNSRNRPAKVHVCLYITLSVVFLLLASLTGETPSSNRCYAVALLLHYTLLSAIAWMTVEAYTVFKGVVDELAPWPTSFLRKAAVYAWGTPLFPVVISAGLTGNAYRRQDICWISDDTLVYAFSTFVVLVFLAHTTAFTIALYKLFGSSGVVKPMRTQRNSRSDHVHKLIMSMFLFILIGSTWVLGYFSALDRTALVIPIIFILLNAIQGVLLFILHFATSRHARRMWAQLLCGKKASAKWFGNRVSSSWSGKPASQSKTYNYSRATSLTSVEETSFGSSSASILPNAPV